MSEASGLIVSAKPQRREHVPLGIVYMIGATILFAASSAVSKWLVASYPIGEVLFTRTGIALITCALFIMPQAGLAVFRTRRLPHHVMRSLSQGCSQTCLLIAFSLMPLAGAIAINFSAPLFTALISALLLKEKVGLARWVALLVGFCGVLIVANPGAGVFQIGALFALANAVLYGSVTVGVRGMTATESAETLILYQLALLTGFFALLLPSAGSRRRRPMRRGSYSTASPMPWDNIGGRARCTLRRRPRWRRSTTSPSYGRASWASPSGATCRRFRS